MRAASYDAILARTALALILAAPIGAVAAPQEPNKVATAPNAASPAAEPTTDAAPAAAPSAAPAIPVAPAAEPAAAPDPLAALDPADRPIAEKIRDLLAAKNDKIFAGKKERGAIETFYQSRNLVPLWLDKGVENARAKAVIARLKNADADGLELSDYKTPNFAGMSPDALAEADLK